MHTNYKLQQKCIRLRASLAKELFELFGGMKRDLLATFWFYIMLVRLSNRLKCLVSMESFKNYEKELLFQSLIFQQDDASVHKAKTVNKFSKEGEGEVLERRAYSYDLNSPESLWAIVKQELRKQGYLGKIGRKMVKILTQMSLKILLSEYFLNCLPFNIKTMNVTSHY